MKRLSATTSASHKTTLGPHPCEPNHICPHCGREYVFEFMEGDHITPWREGGRTVMENCQMLCRECNRRKGAK